jgi:sterol desaturase/sphingolipid hydroxylase (fatty acid hydroxylase superfamily)
MENYLSLFLKSQQGYAHYLWGELLNPSWNNYFYWVLASSLLVWALEAAFPWRKDQPSLRNDFWLDFFYTFWNYFGFSLVVYFGFSTVVVQFFNDCLAKFGINNLVALELGYLPNWAKLLTIFLVRDFLQYNIHRLLHHVPWMWRFHRVHHSTEEMGFGALMRFHFMEHVFYRTLEYLPLAMLGFGLTDFFMVHIFTFVTGQLYHSNLYIPLGKLKYLFSSPQMHLWHHAKDFPATHPRGFNYGITLSVWDYLFKTVHFPNEDPNLAIGLPDNEKVKKGFIGQQFGVFSNDYLN